MFSVDNFYNYLNQYLNYGKKDTIIKSFNVHGSRELKDIIIPSFKVDETKPYRFAGQLVMFDQEPIQLEYFEHWINYDPNQFGEGFEYYETGNLYKNLTPHEFIFRHFSSVYNPILCHSEKDSPEVKLFEENHFQTVHYFYHGLIARDWFRHWRHYNMLRNSKSKRFGMYAREASGSREYRLDLIRRLIPYKEDLYFKLQDPIYSADPMLNIHFEGSDVQYNSDASATIIPEDTLEFQIQIVPETLFDTQKTHLTEKIFKPIVMKQPFIVVGCPKSLEYLKSYGFVTFDDLWDESYDYETDPKKRMDMIIDVVDYLSNLNKEDFTKLMYKAKQIADYNHNHFFSDRFEDILLAELHSNLTVALSERNKQFYTMPGGTFFMYLEKLNAAGRDITDWNRKKIKEIFKYLLANDPGLGRQLMIRYNHLLN